MDNDRKNTLTPDIEDEEFATLKERICQLEKQNKELMELNDQKNKLLKDVAHDLRSSLGAMSNILELYIEQNEQRIDSFQLEMMHQIHSTSLNMLSFVNTLYETTSLNTNPPSNNSDNNFQ